MRNLKRVLSLALALVMMLGMMIITSSAAEVTTKDFTDADEIQYNEAVDVLVALNVFQGYEDDTFNPTGILTREQAAKIICYMLMGPTNAEKLTGSAAFTDVAADRWSAGQIAYCANLGIIAGYGDGTFGPEDELTGVAFGKMLLVALGYDATIEGYVNNTNWATNIAADMFAAEIDVDGTILSDPLTREQAAQMAFQTLAADMVKYDSKGTTITIDGIEIVTGASEAKPTGDTFMQKYFKDLNKNTTTKVADVFGRPGYTWEVDSNAENDIFVADTPVATFTAETSAADVAKALNGYKLVGTDGKSYAINNTTKYSSSGTPGTSAQFSTEDIISVDGGSKIALVVGNAAGDETVAKAIASETAGGTTIEVYADSSSKIVTSAVVINTYADTVATVTKADPEKEIKASVTLTGGATYETDAFAKDDVVLYTQANGDVQTMVAAESVTGTLTSYTSNGKYTIDGTAYELSSAAVAGFTAANITAQYGKEYVYYLGADGKIIYGTSVKGEAPVVISDYALITNTVVEETKDAWGTSTGFTAQVKAVLSDGTSGAYDLTIAKATAGANKGKFVYKVGNTETVVAAGTADLNSALKDNIFTYTLDGTTISLAKKLDAFTGTETANATVYSITADTTVTKASTTITTTVAGKTVIANDSTVFVLGDGKGGTTVKVGLAALENTIIPTGSAVIINVDYNEKTGTATNVAAVVYAAGTDFTAAAATSGANDYVYVDGTYTVTQENNSDVYTYTGVKADGTSIALTGNKDLAAGIYKFNSKNEISGAAVGTKATVGTVAGTTYELGTGNYVTVNDSAKIVLVAKDSALVTGAEVYYLDTSSPADGVIDLIFVTKAAK